MSDPEVDVTCDVSSHPKHDSSVGPASPDSCERAASIFRALGDTNRLRLLSLLAKEELCVSEITELLKDNLPAISQRLKLLRSERIVRARRQGKHIFYSLADKHIAELISNGLAHGDETDS